MACQHCESNRIVSISGKCSDLFCASFGDTQYEGYVPYDLGIGGGDEVEFEFCLQCGQIQGEFPLDFAAIEVKERKASNPARKDFAARFVAYCQDSDMEDPIGLVTALLETGEPEDVAAALVALGKHGKGRVEHCLRLIASWDHIEEVRQALYGDNDPDDDDDY